MSDMNVNSATPNYYRQSVPKSAIDTGIIGLGIGTVSSLIRNKEVLKDIFSKNVNPNELKLLRRELGKNVLANVGSTALFGLGIGAIMAVMSNFISKAVADKKAEKM